MSEQISFGVGCFHFWPTAKPPFTLKIDEYSEHLRETLESIPTVSNIEIDVDPTTPEIHVTEKLLTLSEGEDFLPHPSFLDISFDVYIPYRIQEEITDEITSQKTKTENFTVHIRYAYEAPLTFVELLNPLEAPDPSQGVQIVREYLNREINSSVSKVRFEALGPSPFHADFYICPQDGEDFNEFEVLQTLSRGYDKIKFLYNVGEFTSLSSAKLELFSRLEDELGFYYHLVSSRLKANADWSDVTDNLAKLIDVQGKRKLSQRVLNVFRRGRYINQLFTAMVSLEANQIFRRHLIDEGYRGIYATNEPTYLQFYVDNCLKELITYPTQQIGDVARFLEGRRSKTIELAILLLAALLGGAAGSLLTMLVTKSQ
jgi:hypothetical protein